MRIVFIMITKLTSSLLLLVSSSFVANATRIGETHHRQTQEDGVKATIFTDIPAACEGWKENKIQECIAEQQLIGSILSQHNLDSIPAECAGWNSDKLGECLLQRQAIFDQNGLTSVPSGCEGLQVDKLEVCIADHNLVQTVLSQYNLDSIPAECAGWESDKLGECLLQRQTILDQNGVTSVPSGCEGLQVDELEVCIADLILVQALLSQYNLDSIPSECAGWGSDKLGECLSQRQTILDQNGVTSIPAVCQGLGIDKLEVCIADHNLVQTLLSQHNLNSIPSECAGWKSEKLGECLSQRQTIMDQNGVTTIPAVCQGLGVDKLGACLVDHNLVQTILSANNLDNVPADCTGVIADKLTECLHQWRLTQIILGVSNERIPPECAGMENEKDLEKCLEEFTLAPTTYPTYAPTLPPMTYAPTIWSTYVPTAAPIAWKSFATQIGFEAASENSFSVLEEGQVAVPIGRYAMSVSRYVNKKVDWNSDRHRALKKHHNDGNHHRQHELDATRKHLREVYEAKFDIPVARIDLHFVDAGETAMGLKADGTVGDGIMRHSIFFGNAVFVEGEANAAADLVPTEELLEKVTNDAFTGEQKQAFIEKYHYEVTGRNYFGIKYSYDVNVRKNRQPDVELPTVESSTEEAGIADSIADQEGGKSWVDRIQQWSSSVQSSFGTSTTFIVLILSAGVLLGTLIGLTAIVIQRKRRNRVEKPQSRVIMDDFIDDEPDVLGSEVDNDSDMLNAQRALPSNRIQSSLPIMMGDSEDSVSQLATSDDDSVYKGMMATKELDSGESTREVDSGDSDSTWSFSLRSAGSGNSGKEASDGDEANVEHQLT